MRSAQKKVFNDIVARVEIDKQLEERIKTDPVGTLKKMSKLMPEPLRFDVWIYRIVVLALGITLFATVIGAITIVMTNKNTVPDILIAIGSAAVGALAGLLAPSPKGEEE